MRTPRRAARLTSWVRRLLAASIVTAALAGPVHAQTSESVEYYGTDAVGSVRVVFDASGNILGRMDYTPFGGELFSGQNMPSQRFAGLFRDGEAGLDYAQARSYQVRTGRFNAPDPVYAGMFDPQKWNRYSYAVNSPFSFTDPTGLEIQGVNVNCGLGAYWCPGSIVIRKPDDVDKYFDARQYGYQGGEEMARAEAEYARRVTEPWLQNAVASFEQKTGRPSGDPKPSVTTSTEVVLPDGKRVTVKDGGMLGLARDVSSKAAEPLTRQQVYGEILVVSVAGVGGRFLWANTHLDGPSAGYQHSQGRLFQVRVGPVPLIRVDLHPMNRGAPPAWHVHILPVNGEHGLRFRVWP